VLALALTAIALPRRKIGVYQLEFLRYNRPMTKYICVVLAAGMLAACEKETETVAPSTATPTTEMSPASGTTDTAAETPSSSP
jgi:hypothetical protein